MNKDRLLELAGIKPLNEMAKPDVKEIDFEDVKKHLIKKYGDADKVNKMTKMELTRAAAGMKEGKEYVTEMMDHSIESVVKHMKMVKSNVSKEDWMAIINHVSTM